MSGVTSARQQEVQRIVDSLSMAIAQHRLKPGMRLVEAQIVNVLSANRNHVQAAIQRLALQHIVTIAPNRGAKVARPEAREAREVFIARRAIEHAVLAGISIGKMALHDDEVEAHLLAVEEAAAREDRRDLIRELSQFHLLLARINDNRVLSEMLSNLMLRSSLVIALYQRNDMPGYQCRQYRAVITALRAGQVARAQIIMDEYLSHLEQQLKLDDAPPPCTTTLHDALLTNG